MLIKEACILCGLTKKAIQYYEAQGLISPEQLDNGYRNYAEQDIADLKEIAVLRSCGIAVQHIRDIMRSSNKSGALIKYKHLHELKQLQLQKAQASMEQLIQNYNIEDSFHHLQQYQDQANFTIRERLVSSFPGSYGVYLSLHFGRFLNHPMETKQQRMAYEQILSFLDDIPIKIPDELCAYLDKVIQAPDNQQLEQFENSMRDRIEEALASPEQYFERPNLAAYIAYRSSDEYKQSPQGIMAALMTEFQRHSGYKDIFIANLKVISPSYGNYHIQLEVLNEQLLAKYPEVKEWYE